MKKIKFFYFIFALALMTSCEKEIVEKVVNNNPPINPGSQEVAITVIRSSAVLEVGGITSILRNNSVSFQAKPGALNPNATLNNCQWTFSDNGQTLSGPTISRSFSVFGAITVTLSATINGTTYSTVKKIWALNELPKPLKFIDSYQKSGNWNYVFAAYKGFINMSPASQNDYFVGGSFNNYAPRHIQSDSTIYNIAANGLFFPSYGDTGQWCLFTIRDMPNQDIELFFGRFNSVGSPVFSQMTTSEYVSPSNNTIARLRLNNGNVTTVGGGTNPGGPTPGTYGDSICRYDYSPGVLTVYIKLTQQFSTINPFIVFLNSLGNWGSPQYLQTVSNNAYWGKYSVGISYGETVRFRFGENIFSPSSYSYLMPQTIGYNILLNLIEKPTAGMTKK